MLTVFYSNNRIFEKHCSNGGALVRKVRIRYEWSVSVFGVFFVLIFPHLDLIRKDTSYLSVFILNAEKYGPENSKYGNFTHIDI